MKKLFGLIAVLLLAWLGMTFYIGNNVESKSQELLSNMQEKYKNMGMELKVDIKDKSFFTSKAEMTFDYTNPEMKKILSQFYNLPIKMDYVVEHGPIFFKNGPGVGLTRIHSKQSMVNLLSEDIKEDLSLSDKDFVVTTNAVLSFSKNMSTDLSMTPVNFNNPDSDIGIESGLLQGHFNTDMDTLAGSGSLSLPFVKVFNPESPKTEFYHAENITLDFDIEKFIAEGLYIGDISMKVKEMTLASEDFKDELSLSANIDIKIDEDQDKNLKVSYLVDAEHIKGEIPEEFIPFKINPKKASFDLVVEGLSPEGLIAFQKYSQEIQAKSQELMQKIMTENNEEREKVFAELQEFQVNMQAKLFDLAQGLFAPKKGKITYNASFEDDKKKDSHVNAKVAYLGDKFTGSVEEMTQAMKAKMLDLFTLDVDIKVDDSILLAVQNEMNDREKQQTTAGLEMGIAQGIVKKEENTYTVKVDYEPNKLMLNGKDMSAMIEMIKMQAQQL